MNSPVFYFMVLKNAYNLVVLNQALGAVGALGSLIAKFTWIL